ncbi:hypothetical protein SeGA_4414 [Salmonella enterica subsp. enterica serovar Gaminara str. A4-567]|nr:hypothetical protein SeGA_4414 [Salmonella enterica subsp. enterica serovar Gaminara str. A4-567]
MFFCDFDLINESFEIKWKLSKVRRKKSMSGRHTSGYRLRAKKYRVALALTGLGAYPVYRLCSAGAYPVYRLCGYTLLGEGY